MEGKKISIEYCTGWGYLPKALELAKYFLSKYKNHIESLTLVPSSGGVFEVKSDGNLIFSKKELNRFPEIEELENSI